MYGWTPTETHVTNPDGTVTVTRDSPWDDEERDLQHAYDELVCSSCGNLRAVCADPQVPWYPQRHFCGATAARDVVTRRMQLGHKPPAWDPHPLDGVGVWVSQYDLTPEDDFIPPVPVKR